MATIDWNTWIPGPILDDDVYVIDTETRTIVRNLGKRANYSTWASEEQNRQALGLQPNQIAMRGMRAKWWLT